MLTARQLRSKGIDDARQLALAARLPRILVTYNRRDFLLLHQAWRLWSHDRGAAERARHAGILILPQPPLLGAVPAADLLDRVVGEQWRLGNRFFTWRATTGCRPEG